MNLKPWHALFAFGVLLVFIQTLHINFHSHCTPKKANCDYDYCERNYL